MIGIPKPRPKWLDGEDAKKKRVRLDTQENLKVRLRSGGRCEVFVIGKGLCKKRATEIHHLLGGWRRRGRGDSALARHKQHVCGTCHRLITGHVLRIYSEGVMPTWANPYSY